MLGKAKNIFYLISFCTFVILLTSFYFSDKNSFHVVMPMKI